MSSTGNRGSAGQMSNGSNQSGGSSHSGTSADGDPEPEINNNPESRPLNRETRDRAEAWWSVGEFLESKNLTHQSAKFTLTGNRVFGNQREEVWDLTDSLVELYETIQRTEGGGGPQQLKRIRNDVNKNRHVDIKDWLSRDISHGFVRVYAPDMTNFMNSRLVPVTLSTTVQQVAHSVGLSMNALHVQLNGDIIRRMDAYEHPLVLQNEYLTGLGFDDITRIQEEGAKEDLGYLVRFYSGKPMNDSTFSRNQLQGFLEIKKGGVLQNWIRRLCVLSGTRLLIYKDKYKRTPPQVVQLARGGVEDAKLKGHDFCLKLTSTLSGERIIFLAFTTETEYNRWFKKCKKATDKLPTAADLSNCHLEFLPENIFVNDQLAMLNLRHNVLKERPIDEDIFIIGWLDDLSRFSRLRSLNLADNNLLTFPPAVCHIRTLVELNIASNKLEEIPPDVAELTNLQALHIHNNHLTSLPEEMVQLRKLFILVLAFNRFITVPPVVAQMTNIRVSEIENIIMAGNRIERIPSETLIEMKYVKKVDLRMNDLSLTSGETMKFTVLEHLTHLDIRDNRVRDLDIRPLKTLEYLNCERNDMVLLKVNGMQLKNLFAAQNCLEVLYITPKPEYLYQMDLSYNQLRQLPDWLCDCFFLQKLNVGYNLLTELPARLFIDAQKLRSLRADHNHLRALPGDVDVMALEEVYFNHNLLTRLPDEFFVNANKLRVFNASKNRLAVLPPVNPNPDLNKLHELYLTANMLGDSCMDVISGFPRLKVLHLAHNEIHNIYDNHVEKLELLQELNISGNELHCLPRGVGALSKLVILRAHSNILSSLPDFHRAKSLRVLDVGHNQLFNVSVTSLMASQLNLLDMSLNTQLKVDPREFKSVKNRKSVCLVDATGQNRALPGLKRRSRAYEEEEMDPNTPWKVGFSETSGIRNKLCVGTVKLHKFRDEDESLFAMFDGGHNNEVPKILVEKMPEIIKAELEHTKTQDKYIKYAMLSAHRCLRSAGQKLGASSAVVHIQRVATEQMNLFNLHLANVGDIEVVLCRHGEALVLTRKFVTQEDLTECERIQKSDGIVTEDSKVDGVTKNTRMLGCAFLYPHILPYPFTCELALRNDDEFLIIANKGLWKYISYGHAVEEVYEIGNPVVAAKRLQDIAQGYGSKENISVLVVRLNTDRGPSLGRLRPPHREMSVDDVEAAAKHDEMKAKYMAQHIPRKESPIQKEAVLLRAPRRSKESLLSDTSAPTPKQSIDLQDKKYWNKHEKNASTETLTKDNVDETSQNYDTTRSKTGMSHQTITASDVFNSHQESIIPMSNGYQKRFVDENANLEHLSTKGFSMKNKLHMRPESQIVLSQAKLSVGSEEGLFPENTGYDKQDGTDRSLHRQTSLESNRSIPEAQRPDSLISDFSDREEPVEIPSPPAFNSPLSKDLKPLPNQRFVKRNAAQEWEVLLQKRLSSDVKDKELKMIGDLVSRESGLEQSVASSIGRTAGRQVAPMEVDQKDSDMVIIETLGKRKGKKIAEAIAEEREDTQPANISKIVIKAGSYIPTNASSKQAWYASHTEANPAYDMNPGISSQDLLKMTSKEPAKQPVNQNPAKPPANVRSRIAMFENLKKDEIGPTRKREDRRSFFSPARPEPIRVDVPPRRCFSPPPNLTSSTHSDVRNTPPQKPVIKSSHNSRETSKVYTANSQTKSQAMRSREALSSRLSNKAVILDSREPSRTLPLTPTANNLQKNTNISQAMKILTTPSPEVLRTDTTPHQSPRSANMSPDSPISPRTVAISPSSPQKADSAPIHKIISSPASPVSPEPSAPNFSSPLSISPPQLPKSPPPLSPVTSPVNQKVPSASRSAGIHGSVESDLYSKVKRVKKDAPVTPSRIAKQSPNLNSQVLQEETTEDVNIVEISRL